MLEVIGVGFGRTGTLSLQAALERLGLGPCYHFGEVFAHPEHAEQWLAAARGERGAWSRALQGYRSTVDWPGAAFWRELLDENRNAKAILTTRDPARWFESISQTIFATMASGTPPAAVIERFGGPQRAAEMGRLVRDMGREVMAARCFDGRIDDRDHVLACYERHNEQVRRELPGERLLDFQVGQGWEPLCEFLGVPVPDEPFPHLNERTGMFASPIR
jgi:hypothetical protein